MGILLDVQGIKSGEIAYNPAVIIQGNTKIIAARVESLDSHWLDPDLYDPHIIFFTQHDNVLLPIPDMPVFHKCEDPWATWVDSSNEKPQLLFGAVKIDFDGKNPVITTQIYLAPSVQELNVNNPIAKIRNMKDVRVAQLHTGKIAVFTRPTEGEAYPGRIGFTMIDNINDIEKSITSAKLLKFDLDEDLKIGANEAFEVKEMINVFCNVAKIEPTKLHYAGYQFKIDPNNPFENIIALNKIADRRDFPVNNKSSKGHRYDDVVFPCGTGGPKETQYFAGVEDARIGVKELSPFQSA